MVKAVFRKERRKLRGIISAVGLMSLVTGLPSAAVGSELWFFPGDHPSIRSRHQYPPNDYMNLFSEETPWQGAPSDVAVFVATEASILHAPERDLRTILRFLNSRHIDLAMTVDFYTLVSSPDECVSLSKRFSAAANRVRQAAARVKELGGKIRYADMDEPFYFTAISTGKGSLAGTGTAAFGCRYPVAQVASGVAQAVVALKAVFPDIEIGDSEPIVDWDPENRFGVSTEAYLSALKDWISSYRSATGEPLRFLHADISWTPVPHHKRSNWRDVLRAVADHLARIQVKLGIYYNGERLSSLAADPNKAWAEAAVKRFMQVEAELGITPAHAIISAWGKYPARILPESDAGTLSWVLDKYIEWRRRVRSRS